MKPCLPFFLDSAENVVFDMTNFFHNIKRYVDTDHPSPPRASFPKANSVLSFSGYLSQLFCKSLKIRGKKAKKKKHTNGTVLPLYTALHLIIPLAYGTGFSLA